MKKIYLLFAVLFVITCAKEEDPIVTPPAVVIPPPSFVIPPVTHLNQVLHPPMMEEIFQYPAEKI